MKAETDNLKAKMKIARRDWITAQHGASKMKPEDFYNQPDVAIKFCLAYLNFWKINLLYNKATNKEALNRKGR